jgi:hypothetical protein
MKTLDLRKQFDVQVMHVGPYSEEPRPPGYAR